MEYISLKLSKKVAGQLWYLFSNSLNDNSIKFFSELNYAVILHLDNSQLSRKFS